MTEPQAQANPETPLATRVVRGGAAVALTSYGLVLFGFISNLVLTRLLLPDDFGVFALGVFFYSLLNLRTKLGVDQAFGQRQATDAEGSGTFAVLSIASGAASLLLALIAVPVLLALRYQPPVIWVMLALAGVGISDSIMGIGWVQLDKALLFTRVSLVTAIAFPISYLPAFYLALHGGAYWSLVAQNACYALLLLAGIGWMFRTSLPQVWELGWKFSPLLARRFIRFGLTVGVASTAAILVYQFDNFLVGSVVSYSMAGFYTRAYQIAQWPSLLVSSVLARTAFYAYARLQDDIQRLTRTATMSLWIITTLALPLALAIWITADDLVSLLFTEKWLPSAIFVRYLVTYSILRPLLDDANSLFIAVGHPRRTTLVVVSQAITIVLAATPLTYAYGAQGTAIGVGVTFVVGLIFTYHFVSRTLPALSLSQAFVVPAVASAAALAAYFALGTTVDWAALPLALRVAAKAGLAVAVYFACTLALRPRLTLERAAYLVGLYRNRTA